VTHTSRNVRRGLIGLAAVITVACGGAPAYSTTTTIADATFDAIVLDTVWDNLSGVDQARLCAEVRAAGARAAARIVTDKAPSFSTGQVADKLEEWCL